MSYFAHLLPPDEWPRLAGTEAAEVWQNLDPVNTRVLVVEQEGQIVGVWMALRVVHAECLWIAPDRRHSPGIGYRLIRGMQRIAKDWHVRAVLTNATTDHVRALSQKFGGVEVPGTAFALPMAFDQEEASCQQSLSPQ